MHRLQVLPLLTPFKVAEPPTGPDILQVGVLHNVEDDVVLLLRLHAYGVHAVLAAGVAGLEPVYFFVAVAGCVPGEEVPVAFVEELFWAAGAFYCGLEICGGLVLMLLGVMIIIFIITMLTAK